jgi:hypothetical protein
MERVEFAETEPLQRLCANCISGLRDYDFVREREKRKNVVPALHIRVLADFDLEYPATYPRNPALLHESKNALDCVRLVPYACLALIIRKAI